MTIAKFQEVLRSPNPDDYANLVSPKGNGKIITIVLLYLETMEKTI